MRLNLKKIVRVAAFTLLIIVAVTGLYLGLICHPSLFFEYSLSRRGITLYSDEPIPPEAAQRILDDVVERLGRSPLGTPERVKNLRVYICNRPWRFALFANTRFKVGGLAYPPLSDNVFLRTVHFQTNRLVGYSGKETTGARTLTYYIAHEIMHVLTARELGVVRHWRLPAWKNEGYADLIAKEADFDYLQTREQFRRGERELDPNQSGLYLRYHLLVAYLLDHKKVSVDDLLNRDFDPRELESEILAAVDGVAPR